MKCCGVEDFLFLFFLFGDTMGRTRVLKQVASEEVERFFGKDVVDRINQLEGKKVIAGGAALAFYTGRAFHTDVDVFILGSQSEYEYTIIDEPGVQVVYTEAKTIEELFARFPLSITQIAIDWQSYNVVATEECLYALESGVVIVDVTKFFSEQHLEKHTVKWLRRLYHWLKEDD